MKGKPARDGLAVLIPSSLLADCDTLRSKTQKMGQVARALAVYCVEEVFVYEDPLHPEQDDASLMETLLGYAECPPYLKRRLYGRREELKYVGTIPPLQTPNHAVSDEAVQGEYREGVVLERRDVAGGSARVDVGLDSPAILPGHAPEEGTRISVRTVSREEPTVEAVDPEEIPMYWGYGVASGTPEEAETRYRDLGLAPVGTSRKGTDFRRWDPPEGMALAFGSPLEGVESLPIEFEEAVNTVPEQGTATVRTEEALHASLAVLNLERTPI